MGTAVTTVESAGSLAEPMLALASSAVMSVRERLFEPFFTTKPAGHGLGLGLIISAQIVREFGGHLTVGETGPGATFRFDLEVVGAHADV